MMKRVALVTGASSGIGADAAIQLAAAGFTTYAAARRVERMAPLRDKGVRIIALDVTDPASVDACLARIRAESGGIDVLVNNAGYGSYGAIEEVPMEAARRQFEVNLFGLATLTQRVIPHMREQRWGRIVNVSSIGGVGATPYGGWYHATKFALEGYSSALRQEVAPFGVHVVVVRPGAIMTEWGGIAMESLLEVSGKGPYRKAVQKMAALFTKLAVNPKMVVPPSVIGDVIRDAATKRRPRAVYIAPFIARLGPFMQWLLSERMSDAAVRLMMGLGRPVRRCLSGARL